MKMVFVIFRRSLEEDIRRLLKGVEIKALTEIPTVFGMGDTGYRYDSLHGHGFNSMMIVAMEENLAQRFEEELKAFRYRLAQLQGDAKIPMRILAFQ